MFYKPPTPKGAPKLYLSTENTSLNLKKAYNLQLKRSVLTTKESEANTKPSPQFHIEYHP